MDPGQFGAVGGRDRRADRTVALSYTGVVTQTACWEERSQVCGEIRLTLAEVRRRTPSALPAWGPRGTTPRLTVRGTTAGAPPPPPPPPQHPHTPAPPHPQQTNPRPAPVPIPAGAGMRGAGLRVDIPQWGPPRLCPDRSAVCSLLFCCWSLLCQFSAPPYHHRPQTRTRVVYCRICSEILVFWGEFLFFMKKRRNP